MLIYTSSISLELYEFLILSILKSFQCAVVKLCLTLVLDILTLPINDNNYAREERPKDYSRKKSIGVSDFNNQFLSALNKIKNCVDPKKLENSLAGSWTMMFSCEHKQSSENISSVWIRSLQDYVLNKTETKATLMPSNRGTSPLLTWVMLTGENSKLLPPGKNLRHAITKLSPLFDNILSRTPPHFHKPAWGSPRMSPNPIVPPSSFILGCSESSTNLSLSCRCVPGGSWPEGFNKGSYH